MPMRKSEAKKAAKRAMIKAMKKDFGKMTKEEIIAVCQGTGESTQTNETEEKTEIKLAKSTNGNSKQSKATRD